MRKLKIFGGTHRVKNNRDQVRMIVGATTKKRAVELINQHTARITMREFNDYWMETGNDKEVELATNSPETIFYREDRYDSEFISLNP